MQGKYGWVTQEPDAPQAAAGSRPLSPQLEAEQALIRGQAAQESLGTWQPVWGLPPEEKSLALVMPENQVESPHWSGEVKKTLYVCKLELSVSVAFWSLALLRLYLGTSKLCQAHFLAQSHPSLCNECTNE
ncbi:Hypothetical predicted protein [Marmota monax]|uniref:Uncharacterized protein n=1 Tax=Marmota monax TaxID=9995 RepID=A0A5E4B8N6_MARMO|nr:Hypothetical predicted protein [Marmota monax]